LSGAVVVVVVVVVSERIYTRHVWGTREYQRTSRHRAFRELCPRV